MALIDFILKLAALLLWLNWRAVRLSAATQPSVLSLASALKKAEPRPAKRWIYLAALIVLLTLRAFFDWQVGSSVGWTPAIQLGAISLHFRSDFPGRMLLYSGLSFVVLLWVFYLWLLLLAMINRRVPDTDPLQKIVRLQLGRAAHWPAAIQLLFPLLAAAALWFLLNGWLARLGLAAAPGSTSALWQQAVVLGCGTFLAWKYFIVGLLLAYILNCYVYLGRSPLWNYVDLTGRNLLRPLRWLPLGIGKADFAPVVAIAVVLLAARFGAQWLTWLYQHPLW